MGLVARTAEAAREAARRLRLESLGGIDAPEPGFARAPAVLLAVRDRELAPLARELAGRGPWAGRSVLHLSGALGADELGALRDAGAAVGSFHPLMTFALGPDGQAPPLPPDTPFCAEGDAPAVALARELAAALGTPFRVLPAESKTLYHCAATIAGNLGTVLIGLAEEVLAAAGIEDGVALEAPLARESVLGAARLGPARALSGPVARGDAPVLRAHLAALREAGLPGRVREAHALLSLLAVRLAERGGRAEQPPAELRELLETELRALRALE